MPPETEGRRGDLLSAEQAMAQGISRREYRESLRLNARHEVPVASRIQSSIFVNAQGSTSLDAVDYSSRSAYRSARAGAHRSRGNEHKSLARIAPSMVAAALVVVTGGVVASAQIGSTPVAETSIAATSARLSDVSSRDISAASRSQSRSATSALTSELPNVTRTGLVGAAAAYDNTNEVTGETATETVQNLDEIRAQESFVRPVQTDASARITSEFGQRWGRAHNGIDYGATQGTPLVSVGKGTVTVAAYNSGLGNHVKITLDDGTVIVYGHMSSDTVVEVDQAVMPGDKVGYLGNTGNSTGPHLHFEVRPGGVDADPIDPRAWLEERDALL